MKYLRIIFSILAMATCGSINAQTFNYGVELGGNVSNLSLDRYKSGTSFGIKAGALVEVEMNNRIILQSGLGFVRKHADITGDNIDGQKFDEIQYEHFNFLQLPVMAGYRFYLPNEFSITPELGMYYAYGMDAYGSVYGVDLIGTPYGLGFDPYEGSAGMLVDGVPQSPSIKKSNRNMCGGRIAIDFRYRHISMRVGYERDFTITTPYGHGKFNTFTASVAYWFK